jgi:outer membrane protein assembly factor BamB
VAGDVRDHQVAVVDGVLDGDHVLLAADLREVHGHAPGAPGTLEVLLEVEGDVVLGAAVAAPAEDLAHDTHVGRDRGCGISSCDEAASSPQKGFTVGRRDSSVMPSRRSLLGSLGAAVATGTAGCLGSVRGRLGSDPPVDGPCGSPPTSWSTAGGDAARTGRTATAPPPADAEVERVRLGSREDGGRRLASGLPAVVNGTAFTPTAGGVVAASPSGDPRWAADLDGQFDAVPAVGCGVVFATGLSDTVALDPDTGEVRWRSEDVGGHEATTIAYRDGALYAAVFGVDALNPRTGEERWHSGDGDTLAVGVDGFYTTHNENGDGALYGYDRDGNERFHLTPGKIVGSPTVRDGTVYAVDNGGRVWAVDGTTGETLGSRSPPGNGKLFTGVAVRGNRLLVPAGHGDTSYALDTETGETLWEADTAMALARPVVGPDWVAFSRVNEGITVYDLATGEHRRSWRRENHEFGTVRGIVPIEDGLLVRHNGSHLSLLA